MSLCLVTYASLQNLMQRDSRVSYDANTNNGNIKYEFITGLKPQRSQLLQILFPFIVFDSSKTHDPLSDKYRITGLLQFTTFDMLTYPPNLLQSSIISTMFTLLTCQQACLEHTGLSFYKCIAEHFHVIGYRERTPTISFHQFAYSKYVDYRALSD